MATATATRRKTTAPKVNFADLKFSFGEVESIPELLDEVDRYIAHVNERKPLATSKDKAQYWAGQGQAMKALRATLASLSDEAPEDEDEVEPTE